VTIGFASEAGPDGHEVIVDGEARTLADETRAGTVVRGAYYLLGDSLRIQAEISDEATRSVLDAVEVWGKADAPMDAAGELGQRVMSHLALRFDPRLEEEGAAMLMGGTLPRYEAYSAYMESMDAAYGLSQDIREMLRHANRAFELDSTFFVPLAGALYGHVSLGNIRQADSLIGFLEANQDRLDPFSLAAMGVMRSRLRGDLDGEYRASRDWMTMQPDFGQGLWQLGWAALRVNRPHEALETLNRANPRSWSLRGEWGYWSSLTGAFHLLGRHEDELSAAQRGRDQFPESPNALLYELRALAHLGRADQVVGGLDELISLSSGSPTDRLREVAQELQVHGQRESAREVLDRIFGWYRSRPPSELETQASRFDRGLTHYLAGEWNEADHLFSLVEAGEPSESRTAEAQRLFHGPGHRGVIAARRGDREEALRISQGLSVAEMAYTNGRDDFWRGRIAAVLGDREEAMAFLREAHAQGQAFGLSWHRDPALESLRDYPPFQEFLRPKG
jgi:tetratricopeptide (TPR) repeat protein